MLEPKDTRFVNSDISRLKKKWTHFLGNLQFLLLLLTPSSLPFFPTKEGGRKKPHTFRLCQYEKKKYTKDFK